MGNSNDVGNIRIYTATSKLYSNDKVTLKFIWNGLRRSSFRILFVTLQQNECLSKVLDNIWRKCVEVVHLNKWTQETERNIATNKYTLGIDIINGKQNKVFPAHKEPKT